MKSILGQFCGAALVLSPFFILQSPLLGDVLRVVARTGQPAPGSSPGVAFKSVMGAVINSQGQVAFTATLDGTSVGADNSSGVWSEGRGSLQLVTRRGDAVEVPLTTVPFPNYPQPIQLRVLGEIWLNDTGDTLVRGSVDAAPTLTNRWHYWTDRSGGFDHVIGNPMPAPGAGTGVNFGSIDLPAFNAAGQLAFRTRLSGTGVNTSNDGSYWFYDGTTLEMIAREGSPSITTRYFAGIPAFSTRYFAEIPEFSGSSLNDAGQFVFEASTRSTPTGTSTPNVWSNRDGNLEFVSGVVEGSVGLSVITDSGHVAYRETGTFSNPDRISILAERPTGLWTIAASNQAAPGITGNVQFKTFNSLLFNDAGHVAFVGELQGTGVTQFNDDGIWVDRGTGLELIARTSGSSLAVNDLGDPMYLSSAGGFTPFIAMNALGQVAFLGKLSTELNSNIVGSDWLFVHDLDGQLKTIARAGMDIDIDTGPGIELRRINTIGRFDSSGSGDGQRSVFNDRGQIVFQANFTDGTSAVVVSNLVALVPEPSSFCVLLVGFPLLAGVCRVRFF